MLFGGVMSASLGDIKDMIVDSQVDALAGSVIRADEIIVQEYTNKYYAPFVNGIYQGKNYFVDGSKNLLEVICPVDPNSDTVSFYLEDAGDWAQFENWTPAGGAETFETTTASKLQISWPGTVYQLSSIRGDNATPQLNTITITGAKRGVNIASSIMNTRGKLTYQIITSVNGDYIIRWWNTDQLVAEGTRTGNGVVNCVAMNNSGLSVVCTIAYANDLKPANAFVEIMWPASYNVYLDAGLLANIPDRGKDTYTYLTGNLGAAVHSFDVSTITDDSNEGSFVDVHATVISVPIPPTITSITGTAAALTVNWTTGEVGDTYTAYVSLINSPINFGNYATPAAIVTGVDATSQVLAAVIGYPGKVRIAVRASNGGNQEMTDITATVELDKNGAIVSVRPNRASVQNITITAGLTLNVEGMVLDNDSLVTADTLDLYVQPSGDIAITNASWAASVATVTANSHQFAAGQYVIISNINPVGYNGEVLITATTVNTFSYALTINPGAYVSGGQATLKYLDPTNPQASISLPTPINGVQRNVASYTVANGGWYHVAVCARVTATGSRNRQYNEYAVYFNTATSSLTPTAKVIRGLGP